uniref:Gustatory receptor n=1 Tax=Lutzomyia longipalpis TaxID=7200 RepID=A0A7G3B750_LUTLO
MTRFIVVVDIFMIIEFTFMNRFLLKYLWKLLRCLNSFDKKMATLNAPVNHTLHRKLIIRMMMALMVLYMILGSVNVAAIAISSDLTSQGKFTATLIHKAINRTEDAKVAKKLKEWSLQMVHRQPIMTCGLFPYDWTLLYSVSIIAAICAYVTILIQFDTTKFYSQAAFNGTK